MNVYVLQDKSGRELLSLTTNRLCYPYPVQPHTHNKLEISLVKEGAATYVIDQRRYPMQTGDVFLINNREQHKIHVEPGERLANMVLHFEPEFLWSFWGEDPDYRFLDVFFSHGPEFSNRLDGSPQAAGNIGERLLELERELKQKRPYFDLKVKILIESLLLDILRGYDYFEAHTEAPALSMSDTHRIKKVLHFIDLNIERTLTLEALSKIACLSPAYFSTLFKKYNGVTLFQYISRKRVEHAINLVRTTDYSMTEIAAMCGFNSSASFNKAFQRIRGAAPSYYRQNPNLPANE